MNSHRLGPRWIKTGMGVPCSTSLLADETLILPWPTKTSSGAFGFRSGLKHPLTTSPPSRGRYVQELPPNMPEISSRL